MNPIVKTLTMAIVAAVTCGAAYYYYPKVEAIESNTREKLLTEKEEFSSEDIYLVRIEQFDSVNNQPKQFEMIRRGDSWVIENQGDYPASATGRVASLLLAMSDKKILEQVSENKDDHDEYSVLEASEGKGRSTGVGTTLTFEGRGHKELGKLIIGKPAKLDGQRYVRLAGQPQIYLIELNDAAMSTDLAGWIDPDLLKFGQTLPIEEFQYIDIDYYFIDDAQIRSDGTRKYVYRSRIRIQDQQWMYDLWLPGDDRELPEKPTLKDQPLNVNDALMPFAQQLQGFELQSVFRKQADVALDLSEPDADQPASHFLSLRNQGFRHAEFKNGQHQLDGASGEITIVYKYGLRQKLYFGSAASVDVSGGGLVSRFMVSAADIEMSMLPMPKKPGKDSAADASDESKASDDAAADAEEEPKQSEKEIASQEEAERQYKAEMEARKIFIEDLTQRTSSLNQFHADWIYVVQEDVINRLFPPAEAWAMPKDPAKK